MKGYKHLTPEQQQEILESYELNQSAREVSRILGIAYNTVNYTLKRHGIRVNGMKTNSACYLNRHLLAEWAAEGVYLAEMGRRIGVKHQTVKAFLEKHGIEYRKFCKAGSNNPAWKGGRLVDKKGYVLIFQPDHPFCSRHGYVREHRLVMEKILGRMLDPTEVVHHLDDDPGNNAPENLVVYGSNAEHLAETLKGKVPNHTPDGKRRMRESTNRTNRRRWEASHRESVPDVQQFRGMNNLTLR